MEVEKVSWTNESFIHLFSKGSRRKRLHSNLYIVRAPDCDILMYRPPNTEETLIGVHLRHNRITLIDREALSTVGKAPRIDNLNTPVTAIVSTSLQKLAKDTDITKTKFIHSNMGKPNVKSVSVLVDIDGQKVLFDTAFGENSSFTVEEFCSEFTNSVSADNNSNHKLDKFAYKIYSNAKTIYDARKSLIPNENVAYVFNNLWFERAENFNPIEEEKETIELLKVPPTIYAYGLTEEFNDIHILIDEYNINQNISIEFPADKKETLLAYIRHWIAYTKATKNCSSAKITDLRKILNPNNSVKRMIVHSTDKVEAGLFTDIDNTIYVKGEIVLLNKTTYWENTLSIDFNVNTYVPDSNKIALVLEDWHKVYPNGSE